MKTLDPCYDCSSYFMLLKYFSRQTKASTQKVQRMSFCSVFTKKKKCENTFLTAEKTCVNNLSQKKKTQKLVNK